MESNSSGYIWLCLVCLVPFLLGVASTVIIQARVKKLGWWAFLPLGGYFKHQWENRPE